MSSQRRLSANSNSAKILSLSSASAVAVLFSSTAISSFLSDTAGATLGHTASQSRAVLLRSQRCRCRPFEGAAPVKLRVTAIYEPRLGQLVMAVWYGSARSGCPWAWLVRRDLLHGRCPAPHRQSTVRSVGTLRRESNAAATGSPPTHAQASPPKAKKTRRLSCAPRCQMLFGSLLSWSL